MTKCPVQPLLLLLDDDDDNYNYSRTLVSEIARSLDKNEKTFRIHPVHVMNKLKVTSLAGTVT
jgi:hypothetical protein